MGQYFCITLILTAKVHKQPKRAMYLKTIFSVLLASSCYFVLKTYLNLADLSSLVSDTQFPSTVPLPTVGTTLRLQASYKAQESQ